MSPSTVQISRFSFFSRETNLAFAPCNTASTRAIESFQRNPNGGTNSSAAPAGCAEKTKTVMRPIQKTWPISGWCERVTRIETRPEVSVLIACIYNLLSVALRSRRREISRTGEFGQLGIRRRLAVKSIRCGNYESLRFGFRQFFRHAVFRFAPTRDLHFFSQENFFVEIEN